jgi:hypothetical protein
VIAEGHGFSWAEYRGWDIGVIGPVSAGDGRRYLWAISIRGVRQGAVAGASSFRSALKTAALEINRLADRTLWS